MQDFSTMPLPQLLRPQGWDCPCGQHHQAAIRYLDISSGAIRLLPQALAKVGAAKPFVVCDDNTYQAAGQAVCQILQAASIPYMLHIIPSQGQQRINPSEWELGSMAMQFDPCCDLVLAIGGGVINDLCKVLGHAAGRPTGIIGTAPSMDGFASNSSSMELNHVKTTLYNACPALIILDTAIMAQAPMRLIQAGLGDMLAKYISVCEWRISHLVCGEYYCQAVAGIMRSALARIMQAAPGIPSRDEQAVGAIAQGLVQAGIAMAYAGVSRPASGLEHYFSHMWEMLALERGLPYDLHGIQVGVGTLLSLRIFERLGALTPSRARAQAAMDAFSPQRWESNVRRVFGKTAPAVLAMEARFDKNGRAGWQARLDTILAHWPDILRIMQEELPPRRQIEDVMRLAGMPMTPAQLGINRQDTADAFVCSRDIRDKYLISSLLWDIGEMDAFAAWLAQDTGV